MAEVGAEVMFVTPYTMGPEGWTDEAFTARQNSPATIVERYDKNTPTHDFDEVGPMYRIRFSDGVEMTAWPEEIGLG